MGAFMLASWYVVVIVVVWTNGICLTSSGPNDMSRVDV